MRRAFFSPRVTVSRASGAPSGAGESPDFLGVGQGPPPSGTAHLFSVYPSTLNTVPHKGGIVCIPHPKFRSPLFCKAFHDPSGGGNQALLWAHGMETPIYPIYLSDRGLLLTARRALSLGCPRSIWTDWTHIKQPSRGYAWGKWRTERFRSPNLWVAELGLKPRPPGCFF